jgi:broad specificity phosphatase PhoE
LPSPETFCNKLKILQGQTNSPFSKELTELGYIQSKLLAMRLSKVKFQEIIVSDLNRTRTAAEDILKVLVNKEKLEINFTKLVREKNGGIFEGKDLSINKFFSKVIFIDHFFRMKYRKKDCLDQRAEKTI